MNSPRSNIKLLLLALLWFCGFGLIALSFAKGPLSNPHPFPSSKFVAWGVCCVLVALTWMYWDYKRRSLTSDEKLEQLLLDVARRYRHTRSLDAVIAEYRERGANEGTLDIIRSAPQMLKARADAKIRLGLQLLVTGIITSAGIYWLSQVIGFSHYEVAVVAIGGGVGFIIVGLRQRRAFPKSEIISNA
jgi:hypothetical protein